MARPSDARKAEPRRLSRLSKLGRWPIDGCGATAAVSSQMVRTALQTLLRGRSLDRRWRPEPTRWLPSSAKPSARLQVVQPTQLARLRSSESSASVVQVVPYTLYRHRPPTDITCTIHARKNLTGPADVGGRPVTRARLPMGFFSLRCDFS